MRIRHFLRLLVLATLLMFVASASTAWIIIQPTQGAPSTYELSQQLAVEQNNQTHMLEIISDLREESKSNARRVDDLEAAYNRMIGGGLLFGIVLTFLQVLSLIKNLSVRQTDFRKADSQGD